MGWGLRTWGPWTRWKLESRTGLEQGIRLGQGEGRAVPAGGGSFAHLDWHGCSLSRVGTGLWGNMGGSQALG